MLGKLDDRNQREAEAVMGARIGRDQGMASGCSDSGHRIDDSGA
jgi:hypothetical protein